MIVCAEICLVHNAMQEVAYLQLYFDMKDLDVLLTHFYIPSFQVISSLFESLRRTTCTSS